MTSISALQLIRRIAVVSMVSLSSDGSMPAGRNGPYDDRETPVRNTAHWLITCVYLWLNTGDDEFLDLARRMADFLLSDRCRPFGSSFHLRSSDEKDNCNGLIGQAWVIEALCAAASIPGREAAMDLAEQVFLGHAFDSKYGLWHAWDVDGSELPVDGTLNHQIWFAACGLMIDGATTDRVRSMVDRFLDCLPENTRTLSSGLIYHPVWERPGLQFRRVGIRSRLKNLLLGLAPGLRESRRSPGPTSSARLVRKSAGYHPFVLYGLALLCRKVPYHSLWESEWIRRAIAHVDTSAFQRSLESNEFGYPYNPVGFEVPFVYEVFAPFLSSKPGSTSESWIQRQIDRTYNPLSGLLDRNTTDPVTLSARVYELTRLSNLTNDIEIDAS